MMNSTFTVGEFTREFSIGNVPADGPPDQKGEGRTTEATRRHAQSADAPTLNEGKKKMRKIKSGEEITWEEAARTDVHLYAEDGKLWMRFQTDRGKAMARKHISGPAAHEIFADCDFGLLAPVMRAFLEELGGAPHKDHSGLNMSMTKSAQDMLKAERMKEGGL